MTAARRQSAYRIGFWCLLAAITLMRLALAGRLGLGVDESHYLMYARRLAWGYLDHPPMVAFLAAITTAAGGETLFWIRLGPIICAFLSPVILRRLALRLWGDERVPFYALLLLLLMPYQHVLMVALLPDAALNVFWCGTLLAFWKAVTGGRWRAWMMTGLLLGGALLSKYHALLLPVCLGGYLLSSPPGRHWLKKPQPYAAFGIALAVYLPNLVWNAANHWASYAFQISRGANKGIDPGGVLSALGVQFGVWSPVIFGILLAVWVELIRRPGREGEKFLVWTSLPVFAFFGGIGAIAKVLPHWTSVGWWSGSLAVAAVAVAKSDGGGRAAVCWRRWLVGGAAIGLLLTTVMYVGLFRPIVRPLYGAARAASLELSRRVPAIRPLDPYQAKYDISNELFGWRESAAEVNALRQRMPQPRKTFIFTHRFYEASQIAAFLPEDTVTTTLGKKIDQYRLWFNPAAHLGWDALFLDIDRRRQGPDRYRPLFERVDANPEVLRIKRGGRIIREIRVYRYFGYKGGYQR